MCIRDSNKSGVAIRLAVENLRVMGRATQGVRLINLKGNDSIAAVAKVMREDEEEVDSTEEQTEEGATQINTSQTDESALETQEEE